MEVRTYRGGRRGRISGRVAGAEDVRTSIMWARDHGVQVVPRAGGHSYSGYSTTTGLLVDFSELRKVSVERSTGVVTVEAGARNTDIYDGLQPYGVVFSAGHCPTVAVSGLTLGGGFGFSSRHNYAQNYDASPA
jgi:FAD/FMN-containing dehydrogenase